MSKSYAKHIYIGICCGNNTPYYKAKRKHHRTLIKQYLRDNLMNIDLESIALPKLVMKDKWDEPTDGGFYVDAKGAVKYRERYKLHITGNKIKK